MPWDVSSQRAIILPTYYQFPNLPTVLGQRRDNNALLFWCKYARDIWLHSAYRLMLDDAPSTCFAEILLWVTEKPSSNDLTTFMALAWAAWSYRNKAYFEGNEPNMVSMSQGFVNHVESWIAYSMRTTVRGVRSVSVPSAMAWGCPPEGWVKVNVDAHVSTDGVIGVGVAIRNQRGRVVAAAVRRYWARWKVEMAEACAARFGVMLAHRLGYSKVILESDSLFVVTQVQNAPDGSAPIFHFFEDICVLKNYFSDFYCCHVKRGGNCLAHLIAREYVEVGSERVWLDPIPQSFYNVADYDLI
ncbi:hypothetical protein RDABS01_011770 [Bienertia sinuspersici]